MAVWKEWGREGGRGGGAGDLMGQRGGGGGEEAQVQRGVGEKRLLILRLESRREVVLVSSWWLSPRLPLLLTKLVRKAF